MDFIVSFILFLLLAIASNPINSIGLKGVSLCKVFLFFWGIIFFLRGFHFYGLYDVSLWMDVIVLSASLFFCVGYLFAGVISKSGSISNKSRTVKVDVKIGFRWCYYIIAVLAVYIVVQQLILLLPIIMASGMAEARADLQFDENILDAKGMILMNYFGQPFIKASLVVIVVKLFHQNKVVLTDLVVLFALMLVSFFAQGGRLLLLDIFLAFIYMLMVARERLKKHTKKIIYFGLAVFVGLGVYFTLERGSDLIPETYIYYCGGPVYLDRAISEQKQIFDINLYGLNFYQGFVKPFYGIFEQLGFEKPSALIEANEFIMSSQHTTLDVASKFHINYYMTAFGYAYKDGGIIAVCFDFFIYGILCMFIDKRETQYWGGHRWTALKIVFFYSMLFTMAQSPFSAFLPVMTIFYVYFITSKMVSKKYILKK